MAALIKEHTAKLDDMNRWIMEYRLGLTGPICNIFVNLRDKMLEEHSIEIDRDDIIAAERKLFRLMRLALAERRTKKDETR